MYMFALSTVGQGCPPHLDSTLLTNMIFFFKISSMEQITHDALGTFQVVL